MFGRCLAILSVLSLLPTMVLPAPAFADAASCNTDKLSSLSVSVASLMRCRARSVAKGNPPDPVCLAEAESRLTTDFAQAEGDVACASTGEITDVISALRAFDDDLLAALVVTPAGDC